MPKPEFAADKLMETASRRRETVSALLRADVAERDDEVIGSVLVDKSTAEWLCESERGRWRGDNRPRRSRALHRHPRLRPTDGRADIRALASLRRRGHSEISSHILEIFGGSVWMLGRNGLYFTCKPTPRKDEDRKVNCIPYSALGTPRLSHFPGSTILELMSRDGWFVAQLVFDGVDRSKAQDAAMAICRCLEGPHPPGPRKRKRPPAKPGSSDPGFSLPATSV